MVTIRYIKQHRINIECKFTIEYFTELTVDLTFHIWFFCLLSASVLCSDVVLESGSVLESDSSTYFEDSDSNPLDSDLDSSPLDSDSDSNPRTRLDSRCSGIGLSTV